MQHKYPLWAIFAPLLNPRQRICARRSESFRHTNGASFDPLWACAEQLGKPREESAPHHNGHLQNAENQPSQAQKSIHSLAGFLHNIFRLEYGGPVNDDGSPERGPWCPKPVLRLPGAGHVPQRSNLSFAQKSLKK